ncbi:helix-turn-helix domain-containing protein [Actinotalea sp. BY-33]|uniref:Helix-turn-helix domain-containing protein n=1 Tax=Actinotalea soli TaxID=2819234 RepID=A0A939LUW4_9CELL|nr:helix-turn-helix domain-containing protein [Actinotalea soli]MBO1752569.1 helix-turn-helix domain-containing protein [Actinotalea soli]
MHRVVVLAPQDVIAFDLATPVETLGRVVDGTGTPLYRVRIAGPDATVRSGPIDIVVPYPLAEIEDADTIVVPGRNDPTAPLDDQVRDALRHAAQRGARIASICVGALDLAQTGLLDGLRATTHWRAVALLRARHPRVEVAPEALYVDNGQLLCSAGAAAGIDLCLHLVDRDFGADIAADAARTAVVPLTREASQAQYIKNDMLGGTSLTSTLEWIEAHASEPITVADIAAAVPVSTRTLNRRFLDELGLPPSRWLIRARVRIAQGLLETTDLPIDQIASRSGLGSPSNLRARFADIVGTSPGRYRKALTTPGSLSVPE